MLVYVRRGCDDPETEVACAKDFAEVSEVTFQAEADTPYYIFVDGALRSLTRDYSLRLRSGGCD